MSTDASKPETDAAVARLLANHRRFLNFLTARVGSREDAEDILQDAFVRGLQKVGQLRDDESAVAWFYRLLRNAVIDHYRRRSAAKKAFATNLVTLVVMVVSSIGVIQSLLNKRKIRCACLGTVFNLPMSTVTLVEDGLMVAMAAGALLGSGVSL